MAMKWYLHIKTNKGGFAFPYNGYKTKKEAAAQAERFKKQPGTISVEIRKA